MRELSLEENDTLLRGRKAFDSFLEERMPVLADFMQRLELPNPALVLVAADQYLPAVDQWLKNQVIEPQSRVWLLTRIGYFVGEYLVQRHGGCWFLNEAVDSKFFARYVVGRFGRAANAHAMVEPFAVADACMAEPLGRSLFRFLTTVEKEIESIGG